eukprot:1304980-Prymnesium_polylepis.1
MLSPATGAGRLPSGTSSRQRRSRRATRRSTARGRITTCLAATRHAAGGGIGGTACPASSGIGQKGSYVPGSPAPASSRRTW